MHGGNPPKHTHKPSVPAMSPFQPPSVSSFRFPSVGCGVVRIPTQPPLPHRISCASGVPLSHLSALSPKCGPFRRTQTTPFPFFFSHNRRPPFQTTGTSINI